MRSEIVQVQSLMQAKNISFYIVPTSDFHDSEYVCDHFQCRRYLSGFTGSTGTLLIALDGAYQWADGRYYIQAANQLSGSGIQLMRAGEKGVPTLEEFLEDKLKKGDVLGFDGRVVSESQCAKLEKLAWKKGAKVNAKEDLAGLCWKDRPALPVGRVFLHDVQYCGVSREEKLRWLREEMKKKGADAHILTVLDDLAWLFNIRGNDILHTPVALAYGLITQDKAQLFLNPREVSGQVREALKADGVEILDYSSIYEKVKALPEGCSVLLDKGRVQSAIVRSLGPGVALIDEKNPTTGKKAVKNPVELENIKAAHIRDGLYVTRFIKWIKEEMAKGASHDELDAAEYLKNLRAADGKFIDLSFSTICAYGKNAAMMHYSATEESFSKLEPKGFLLVDSGAQYWDATTDVTRTIALGPLTQEQKVHFTAVAKGMLNLQAARFLKGCKGVNLDVLARAPVWELGIDYKCGTGHGVGFVLGVHEGPNGFRMAGETAVLEEGMVTTNEPGIYIEGSHGIRTENEMVCVMDQECEWGTFLRFEPLTVAPIDLDGILPEAMSERERRLLNQYHEQVYQKLAPLMEDEEREWLKYVTRTI